MKHIKLFEQFSQKLAPNGKPSKLNSIQYDLVRTAEFKAWFGDWEKSPQTSSKVIDENGEPKLMWHGSDNSEKITEFKSSKGFDYNFFSEDQNETSRYVLDYERFAGVSTYQSLNNEERKKYLQKRELYYKNKIKPFFIDAKKIFEYSEISENEKNIVNKFLLDNQNEFIAKIEEFVLNMAFKSIEHYFKDELEVKFDDNYGLLLYVINNSDNWWILETDIFQKFIKDNRYDAFVTYESGTWNIATYKSNQSKLADGSNITFNKNNPDIRY